MSTAANLTPVSNPFATLSTGTADAAGKTAESTASADRFLTMLVTQLKNQDPLNPMENAQITSQMAQINAVTGLEKVNESVKALSSQLLQMQAWQGASLVGRDVLVQGDRLAVQDGVGVGVIELEGTVSAVSVSILDANGRTVGSFAMGPREAGRVSFEHDMSRLPAGQNYTFAVSALNGSEPVPARTLAVDRVQSVGTASDGLTLSLLRGGDVPVRQVVAFQ